MRFQLLTEKISNLRYLFMYHRYEDRAIKDDGIDFTCLSSCLRVNSFKAPPRATKLGIVILYAFLYD